MNFKTIGKCWLDVGLNHLSPTQINKPLCGWWYEYVYKTQEWRRARKPNAKMIAGNSAQHGWDGYFLFNQSQDEAIAAGIQHYQKQKGLFINDEKEMKQFEVNLEAIPKVITNYIAALKDLEIKKVETVNSERYVELWIDGITVPYTGRTDMETKNFFIEAKTKWQRRSGKPKKDGTHSFINISAPKTPDAYHVNQVCFYKEATQKPGYLVYATPTDYKIYSSLEHEELGVEAQKQTIDNFFTKSKKRQNLLELSQKTTVEYVAKNYVEADLNNINYYGYNEDEITEVKRFYNDKHYTH